MPEKEAPQPETWAGQNFKNLELEIDKEIDSLFIPIAGSTDGNAGTDSSIDMDFHLKKSEDGGTPKPTSNLEAVQTEIDREIDKLFVPAQPRATDRAEPNTLGRDLPPKKSEPFSSSRPNPNLEAVQTEIDREIDKLFVPVQSRASDSTDADALGRNLPPAKGEAFDSFKPASNFDAVPTGIDGGMDKLFAPAQPRVSSSVSSPYAERLDSGARLSGLIEQFNAAYLSLDWEFSSENLKKFIDSLQQLKPLASRSLDAMSVFRILEVILKRLVDRPHAVNSRLVQLIRDSQGLLAHMLLLEGESGAQEKRRLKELVDNFQDLRQKALAAKGAGTGVPPVSSYALAESPHAGVPPVPGCALAESPRAGVPPVSGCALAESPRADSVQASEPKRATSAQTREKVTPDRHGVYHADAFLLVSAGKCCALPASCVVKTARVTSRLGRQISKRGYATLSDFKPLFGTLKIGLLGEWVKLDAQELGAYRFELAEFPPAGDCDATGQIAVLASDGQMHRILFCDAVHFLSDAQIAAESPKEGRFPHTTDSRVLVRFFDLPGFNGQGENGRGENGRDTPA
ncbi:MAG: hypothetical protein ACP5SH_10575 [Syntrophobacteraceae bacterium]